LKVIRPMPTPFSADDLGRVFDARLLTRGRTLVLIGAVEVALDGPVITGTVEDPTARRSVRITPALLGSRVTFDRSCTCGQMGCTHMAATAIAALERFPALRKAEQRSLFDALAASPAREIQRLMFDLAPASPPHACFVSTFLVGQTTGRVSPTSPLRIAADEAASPAARELARLLGGNSTRTAVGSGAVPDVLALLVRLGSAKPPQARWAATRKPLVAGEVRIFDAGSPPRLPVKSSVILSDAGPWYIDAASGQVGRVRLRQPRPAPRLVARAAAAPAPRAALARPAEGERVIVERPPVPVLRLNKLECPDDYGRMQKQDALTLDFDYGGELTSAEDERQFVRASTPAGPIFIRRDLAAEAAAFQTLNQEKFVQMRVADGRSARGRRAFLFRGREASEAWQHFAAVRVPALEALGWRSLIDRDFGPRLAGAAGAFDVKVQDATPGRFSLDFGIEIEGVRHPLLPILSLLHERGGMASAKVIGDDLIASLPDGRVVRLPASRIARLLAIMGDLLEAADRHSGALVLPESEAFAVLELEDLLTTRYQNASAITAYLGRLREEPDILPVVVPASFKGVLRPYQHHGVNWLQHLREHGLGGFLADDMGLGKTAQTIAHLVVEHAAGRLDRPALVVVPTSLISNWTAELRRFAPHLAVEVLHGTGRHERRGQLADVHVVVTTYTVLARDIEAMKALSWHIVVLDEAQAIKSPDAKATRAVCQLQVRQPICLSGTPIENNLDELWSQFAFLMPGRLGDRRNFTKRYRTPIEKNGDEVKRVHLVRRIQPFILRRTKSEVATELPPKHTILRRITLSPEQRELYETIRVTLYEKVREQVAERGLAQSRIVVLDALLKLRQACCDPRLVKLPSARLVESSSKLEDLMEMMGELIPEGRRILLFSQFTSMLDLIKPRLDEAGIRYAELRGDTRDRAEPVRSFEAGEVPLFLISLKAGGRGLNLTSADTVIHYDPWWNPAVEDQASDRAHRIGQTKSVFVYKLVAADTVEERILEMQQRKAELAGIAFGRADEEAVAAMGGPTALDFADIDSLFAPDLERDAA
jgi:superfamily II DNA or RNA helicase